MMESKSKVSELQDGLSRIALMYQSLNQLSGETAISIGEDWRVLAGLQESVKVLSDTIGQQAAAFAHKLDQAVDESARFLKRLEDETSDFETLLCELELPRNWSTWSDLAKTDEVRFWGRMTEWIGLRSNVKRHVLKKTAEDIGNRFHKILLQATSKLMMKISGVGGLSLAQICCGPCRTRSCYLSHL